MKAGVLVDRSQFIMWFSQRYGFKALELKCNAHISYTNNSIVSKLNYKWKVNLSEVKTGNERHTS